MDWQASVEASAVQHAPMALCVVGHDATIRAWNDRAVAITGWTVEDAVGNHDPGMVDPAEVERVRATVAAGGGLLGTGRRVMTRRRADGRLHALAVQGVTPVELDDGPGAAVWFDVAGAMESVLARRHRLSSALLEAHRPDEIDEVLADAVEALLGGAGAIVLRSCPAGEHLHGMRAIGDDTDAGEAVELPLGDGNPWDAALDGGIATDHQLQLPGRQGTVCFVPMGPSGSGWVFALFGRRDTTALADELARAVADEAWIAFQRTALVAELEGKVEILEATHALASSVGLELDEAVAAVARRSAAALSCERAAVYLVDDDGEVVLGHVHATDAAPQQLVSDDEGLDLARQVVARGEQQLFQDAASCAVADGPWHGDAGAVSLLGLPLAVGERVVGALVVAHTVAHPRGFTNLCQQVGAAVAQQAAIAVEQARLYAEQRSTVDQLLAVEQDRAAWYAGLTHDLKGPLTGLLGFVETLQRMRDVVTDEERDTFLATMKRQAHRLVSLVDDLLLAASTDVPAGPQRDDRLDVHQLVEAALTVLRPEDRERVRVEDRLDDAAVVVGDGSHLSRVVQNLVVNAVRHGGEHIEVVLRRDDGHAEVAVHDDGPGVPPDRRELVFERFAHGGGTGSSGLGLHVARAVARGHGGDVRLGESPLGGALFALRLPLARPDAHPTTVDGTVLTA